MGNIIKMNNTCEKYTFDMSSLKFFESLVNDDDFRNQIIYIFLSSSFSNVYWEFPPFSLSSRKNQAEFVLIKALPFPPYNEFPFREYFVGKSQGEVINFPNISGDTNLISVTPSNSHFNKYCTDISTFMYNVSPNVKHDLLIKIGQEMLKHKNSNNKVYLSTHGRGIAWLHVRICNSPKYYAHVPYTLI